MKQQFVEGVDYYTEDGRIVFTEKYHLDRGSCCGKKCRHCPYEPKYTKGNTKTDNFKGESN